MKKILFIFSIVIFNSVFAQDNIKKPSLGLNFFLSDFQMAKDIRKNGLSYIVNNRLFFQGKNLNPGLALSYLSGISKHIDFSATLGGSFVKYPFESMAVPTNEYFLLEATGGINAKLLSDKFFRKNV